MTRAVLLEALLLPSLAMMFAGLLFYLWRGRSGEEEPPCRRVVPTHDEAVREAVQIAQRHLRKNK